MDQVTLTFVIFIAGAGLIYALVRFLEKRDSRVKTPPVDVLIRFKKLKASIKPGKELQKIIDTDNRVSKTNEITFGQAELNEMEDGAEKDAAKQFFNSCNKKKKY